MGGRHKVRRWGRGTLVLTVVLAVLILGTVGTAFAAMSYDRSRVDLILPGVRVDGIDVGGMTAAQAAHAVQPQIDRRLQATITVSVGSATWTKTLADLGVSADVGAAVQRALAVNDRYSWWSRAYHRWADKPVTGSFDVGLSYDTAPVTRFVTAVAKKVRVEPSNASFGLVDGHLKKVHARLGHALKTTISAGLLAAAVRDGDATVTLPTTTIAPKVGNGDIGKVIVVDVSENMLYLYDNFKVIRRYPVATAMQGFVTPDGAWKVVNKVENPTWYNPCLGQPGCWAADEPAMIPPGPGNPLGTRALYLNAPGIRIHGTPEDSSIGHWASHGCIRMHIPESEALYPLVPVGTPVFIIGTPPWGESQNPGPAG